VHTEPDAELHVSVLVQNEIGVQAVHTEGTLALSQ
jgi:hypothetical protein